jgi:hypothetical protein
MASFDKLGMPRLLRGYYAVDFFSSPLGTAY